MRGRSGAVPPPKIASSTAPAPRAGAYPRNRWRIDGRCSRRAANMFLYHRQYIRFLRGQGPSVAVVAFLPGDLAARVPTLSTEVRLGRDYAKKIWEKHRLGHEHLGLIQPMIDDGWCTKSRADGLDFLYVDDRRRPARYILGIKGAKRGHETWVTTLYAVNEDEVRRRLRRANKEGTLIRSHRWT